MRVMKTKLPEGDWLCEECMLKENAENKKVVHPEGAREFSKVSSFDKSRRDFVRINPNNLFKCDDKLSIVSCI